MVGIGWRTLQRRIDHFGNTLITMGAGSSRALFVLQSFYLLVVKATAPFANRDVANAESLGDHHVGLCFRAGQNDLRMLHHIPCGSVREWAMDSLLPEEDGCGLEGDQHVT